MCLCIRHLANVACGYIAKFAYGIAYFPWCESFKKFILCHNALIEKRGKNFIFMRLCTKGKQFLCISCIACAPTEARKPYVFLTVLQKAHKIGGIPIANHNEQKVIPLRRRAKLAHQLTDQEIFSFVIFFCKRQSTVHSIKWWRDKIEIFINLQNDFFALICSKPQNGGRDFSTPRKRSFACCLK